MTACHWVGAGAPWAAGPAHAGSHDSCTACPAAHCQDCGTEHVAERTCPRCVGAARADLADVATLFTYLPEEALHRERAPIPGGDALVMLAPGARAYEQMQARAIIAAVDKAGRPLRDAELAAFTRDEVPTDPASPLQVLAVWEADWRQHLGLPARARTTVDAAVTWMSGVLDQVAQTHSGWQDFTHELRGLRVQLEAVLNAGNRAHEGARCPATDCGALLRQPYRRPAPCTHSSAARRQLAAWLTYVPGNVSVGVGQVAEARRPCERTGCDQGGRRDTWRCPACRRTYTEAEYRLAVAQDSLEHDGLRIAAEVARALGVPASRVRLWAHRGRIVRAGTDKRGRPLYDMREVRRAAMVSALVC